jgi:hypothetical protein
MTLRTLNKEFASCLSFLRTYRPRASCGFCLGAAKTSSSAASAPRDILCRSLDCLHKQNPKEYPTIVFLLDCKTSHLILRILLKTFLVSLSLPNFFSFNNFSIIVFNIQGRFQVCFVGWFSVFLWSQFAKNVKELFINGIFAIIY